MTYKENIAKDINVPHKDQIIIDGVNVSGCNNHSSQGNCIIYGNIPCDCFPDCDFKQLARKTQECGQKEKEINELHLIIDRLLEASGYDKNISTAEDFEDVYTDIDYKLGLIDDLKQECEELKEYIQANKPTGICETCTAQTLIENDKYRKALEDIEKLARDFKKDICNICGWRNTDGCSPSEAICEYAFDILNIINKAKGEEND